MSGSVRRHISKRVLKEETELPDETSQKIYWRRKGGDSHLNGSDDPNWSDLEANDAWNDSSELPFWEPLPEMSGAQMDDDINEDFNGISETMRPWGAGDSYSIRASPGFDGMVQRNYRWSQENNWRRSYRRRSRSRSRSRSWSWSHSPVRNFKQESYRWRDRSRSRPRVLSQPCTDFAAGRCRRGSQCRFFHQDNLKNRDWGYSEIDLVESWKSSQEYRGALRYASTEGYRNYPRDKVSHGYRYFYDGERNESLRKSSRSTNRYNDFLKGKFHTGSSRRYAHHGASGDGYDRRIRNAPFDYDRKREPHRSGDTLCKYFAMGYCRNGDYCRFFHDGPASSNSKRRSWDDRWGHDLNDEKKSWGGPKWNDTTVVSDIAKSTKWGDSDIGKMNFTDAMAAENSTCSRWGNESRSSSSPVWKNKAAERDEHHSSHWGSGSSGANIGVPESMVATNLSVKEEPPFTPGGSQPQILNGLSIAAREQNISQEASGLQFSDTFVHPTVSESSSVQQHFSQEGNNNAISASSNSHNDANSSGNNVHVVLVPGQSFKQDGDSLGSQPLPTVNETSQSQQTLSLNPSSGHTFDLNEPVQQIISALNPQSQIEVCQGESVKIPAMVESIVPRVTSGTSQNEATREQVTQITNLSVSAAQVFGNEQQLPHLYASLNPSTGMVPSLPNSGSVSPAADSKAVQFNRATWSQEQYKSVGDSIDSRKSGNSEQPPAFLSSPIGQRNQETPGPNFSEFNKSDHSEEEHQESSKLKRQEPIANSETRENSRTVSEECKQDQEIGHSENGDVDGRVEEGSRNKDEKDMLTFKIALAEFVKEILKPTWKEGRMSKEIHKTIVRKVVDKVIGTIQRAQIPKTKENIDHYLTCSRPKITKLVQAYVEIYPKSGSDA
ncbi:hypothetical protein L1049_026138 [Liquidambar formosana]|uniref:C3H1-type domain-containing protein n=1 Tax=Liquidambar formosana TaxID=63359 RepID=A0AAP0NC75_LIQFO